MFCFRPSQSCSWHSTSCDSLKHCFLAEPLPSLNSPAPSSCIRSDTATRVYQCLAFAGSSFYFQDHLRTLAVVGLFPRLDCARSLAPRPPQRAIVCDTNLAPPSRSSSTPLLDLISLPDAFTSGLAAFFIILRLTHI